MPARNAALEFWKRRETDRPATPSWPEDCGAPFTFSIHGVSRRLGTSWYPHESPGIATSHGLTGGAPAASKSPTSRVAMLIPCTRAMAAIRPSATLIGVPARSAAAWSRIDLARASRLRPLRAARRRSRSFDSTDKLRIVMLAVAASGFLVHQWLHAITPRDNGTGSSLALRQFTLRHLLSRRLIIGSIPDESLPFAMGLRLFEMVFSFAVIGCGTGVSRFRGRLNSARRRGP